MKEQKSSREKPDPAVTERARPRRRWRRWVIGGALLLLVLLAIAPTLASALFLHQLLALASTQVNGQVAAKQIRLSWLSPVTISDLQATDRGGQPILSVANLRTEKSLFGLLFQRSAVGTIHAESPQVRLVVRPGGSNLEDFLEPLLRKPVEKKGVDVGWNVVNARIEVYAAADSQEMNAPINKDPAAVFVIPKFSGMFQRNQQQAWQAVGEIQVSARDQNGRDQNGKVQLDTRASGIQPEVPFDIHSGNAHMTAKLTHVPLAALAPILRRFTADVQTEGTLDGDLQAELKNGHAHIQWQNLAARDNRILIAAVSREAPIAVDKLESSGEIDWDGDEIRVVSSLASDFGSADLKVTSLAAGDNPPLMRVLTGGNVDLTADLDLPRLARVLPDRMGLRDDVSISSGAIALTLRSQPAAHETLWTAALQTSDLAGRRGATEVVWPEPIQANLTARWSRGRVTIDDLECQSEFLTANLKGTADDAVVQLSGDLERLAQRMKQFFDMPATFGGKLAGHVQFTRRPPELLVAGELTATDFTWFVSPTSQLVEPTIVLSGNATLRQDSQQRFQELSRASLQLVAGDDEFRFAVQQPVSLQSAAPAITVALVLKGNLAQWKNRAQTFADLQAWSVRGLCDAKGELTVQGPLVAVSQLQAEVHDLVVLGDGVAIDEPLATVDIAGQWNGTEKKWTTTRGEIRTSALAASGDDVELVLGDAPAATGKLMVRADLARLQNWFPPQQATPPRWQLAGEFVGEAFLKHEQTSTLVQLDGAVEGFEVVTQPRLPTATIPVSNPTGTGTPVWQEKEARFTATARWRPEGALDLQSAKFMGDGWALGGEGNITGLPAQPILTLNGSADYDWSKLAPRLRMTAGNTLTIVGQRHDPIQISGPLFSTGAGLVSPDLKATGAIGWDSATFQGIVIGAGQMRTELNDSLLQLSLLEVPVSEGTFSIAPRLDFRQTPARFQIPPGTVLKDIRITPAMCRTWLKYAVPVMAEVPKAEGSFDLQFQRVDVPLGFPERADLAGSVVLHEGRLGAGPLTEVILRVADAISVLGDRNARLNELAGGTWVEIPSQTVAFEMKDGRVVHRELQLKVKNVTLYTRGSMGIDQTYDLIVEVPIPESNNPNARLTSLRGRTYRFPLHGKLGQPLEIGPILADLARQLTTDSAGAAAEGLLEEGLKRLLRNR